MSPSGTGIAAILAAGGKGVRMGTETPKQFLEIGGRPLFSYSLGTLLGWPEIKVVGMGVPEAFFTEIADCLIRLFPEDTRSGRLFPFVGGRRRQDTAAIGVRAVARRFPAVPFVMVHDAARPFLTRNVLERISETLESGKAFGVGISSPDTLWKMGSSFEPAVLESHLDREGVFRAQTPQGAPVRYFLEAIEKAEANGDPDFTDEAGLLSWAGFPVVLVQGEESNRKVTTPEDLSWAEDYLRTIDTGGDSKKNPMDDPYSHTRKWPRTGHGFDVHPFESGRELWLGGVRIPHSKGLAGHSDADAVIHALCDALLGGLALGDIGRHFPPSDERYRGQKSLFFLERVVGMIREKGYRPYQVDLTIMAERPKISPHVTEMQNVLAKALGISPSDISIKATTTEKLGFVGREEGLGAMATATLVPEV